MTTLTADLETTVLTVNHARLVTAPVMPAFLSEGLCELFKLTWYTGETGR